MIESILLNVISGLIVGILLLIIERLLIPKSEKSAQINTPVQVIETRKIIVKEKTVYKTTNSEDDSNLIIFFCIIGMVVALINYIKFYTIIHFIIILMSTAIGIMAIGMAGVCVHRGIRFKKDLNIMLIFNLLSIISVPFLVWQTIKASELEGINMELLKMKVTQTENFSVFEDMTISFFLIYQIIGLIFSVIYMLLVLISNIYLISLINLNCKLRRMWDFLNIKTYKMVSKPANNIIIGVVFLVLSYLMVSGTILDILNVATIG